jgi:Flp pilus assembly protein protease CpaA
VLTVPAFAGALLYAVISGALDSGLAGAGRGLLFALGGFATGFGILWVAWMVGASGGGDVKYMGALGAWLGAWLTLQVLVLTTLLAAVMSLGVLAWEFGRLGVGAKRRYLSAAGSSPRRGKNHKIKETAEQARQRRMVRRRLLPLGVPAALATWSMLIFNELARHQ